MSVYHLGMIVALSYFNRHLPGVFVGANNSFITVYAQILLESDYQQYSKELGYLGLGIQAAAILALLLVGKFLDFTRTFL